MDTTIDLKNKVLKYVNSADERLLRMMQALAESYQIEETNEPTVPDWFYEELDERRERHLKGESKSYSWEEVKESLRKSIEK
jgi:hypothetical protein